MLPRPQKQVAIGWRQGGVSRLAYVVDAQPLECRTGGDNVGLAFQAADVKLAIRQKHAAPEPALKSLFPDLLARAGVKAFGISLGIRR